MVQEAANQGAKDSVTDYLDALTWDGTPRIDRWLVDGAGAEDVPRVREASRWMLMAAVRRARVPGCRFDQVPVLIGPPGSGKSSALRELAVADAWFAQVPTLLEADAREVVAETEGRWIVELSELSKLLGGCGSGARAKEFLSRTHDAARRLYARQVTRVPRQFMVVGSTCDLAAGGLTEAERRLVLLRVWRFDLDWIRRFRDQLWAEASAAEASGQALYVPGVAA